MQNAAPRSRARRVHLGRPLPSSFYSRDTELVTRELLGAVLECHTREGVVAGRIVETEAYPPGDPTGYARPGLTTSNAPLFESRGHAYVRMLYGS